MDSVERYWQRRGTGIVSYAQAVSACTALGSGWRVPTGTELSSLVTVSNPAGGTNAFTVNSCAFPISFDTTELRQNQTNGFFQNRFWTSDSYTPPASWNCPTSAARWVTDLWTGDTNWAACVETAGAEVLCVSP
jgi:hypothetical protein